MRGLKSQDQQHPPSVWPALAAAASAKVPLCFIFLKATHLPICAHKCRV